MRMRSSYTWTMKPWQRSEWRLGFNSVLLNADWAGPTGMRTIENFKSHLRPALDHKPCSLARWTRSIHIQQNSARKGIGGVIIEMLVSVSQTR